MALLGFFFLKKLSNVFGVQSPGNFGGNSFLEKALNQSVLQPKRSPVASAGAVTSVEANAIVRSRLTHPPQSGQDSLLFWL